MNDIDGKSLKKAIDLFETGEFEKIAPGTVKGLVTIHKFIFKGLYDFAGQVRIQNIAKGNFRFANALYLKETLTKIETLLDYSFEEIISKYVEMNIAHPFLEGNGRAMRIWLDRMLKERICKIVDWHSVSKESYFKAMERSPIDESELKSLLKNNLTTEVNNLHLIVRGLEQSYFFEGYEKGETS